MNGSERLVHLFGQNPMGRKAQRSRDKIPVKITAGTTICAASWFEEQQILGHQPSGRIKRMQVGICEQIRQAGIMKLLQMRPHHCQNLTPCGFAPGKGGKNLIMPVT